MASPRALLKWVIVGALFAVVAFLALRASPYLQYIPWLPRRPGFWSDHHGVSRNIVAFFGFALAVFLLIGTRAWQFAALCAIEIAGLN